MLTFKSDVLFYWPTMMDDASKSNKKQKALPNCYFLSFVIVN